MTIHLGDCMDFMKKQSDDTYDIIIADPPYETTDITFDKTRNILWKDLAREFLRVLKPNGWLFVFGNIIACKHFLDDWRFKFEYVWVKTSPVMATHATIRPLYQHEPIYALINPELGKMSDLYFDKNSISTETSRTKQPSRKLNPITEYASSCRITYNGNTKQKNKNVRSPSTVLYAPHKPTMPFAERTKHPTQKPVSIYETLLKGYSPPRGLAFDPFGGSGTLAIAAMNTGREYHLTELNPEYHSIIKERVARHIPRLETARKQQTMTAHMGASE